MLLKMLWIHCLTKTRLTSSIHSLFRPFSAARQVASSTPHPALFRICKHSVCPFRLQDSSSVVSGRCLSSLNDCSRSISLLPFSLRMSPLKKRDVPLWEYHDRAMAGLCNAEDRLATACLAVRRRTPLGNLGRTSQTDAPTRFLFARENAHGRPTPGAPDSNRSRMLHDAFTSRFIVMFLHSLLRQWSTV